MKFKENLKAELTYKAMQVKELAMLSGVNKRTIDNYLRANGAVPSADSAVKIARVLGVSVEYLVTGGEIHWDTPLSALPPDMRFILQCLEELDDGDRRVVLNLIKSLKERETAQNAHNLPGQ
jgi:transcriptional regulator with XRE-family HTH domain